MGVVMVKQALFKIGMSDHELKPEAVFELASEAPANAWLYDEESDSFIYRENMLITFSRTPGDPLYTLYYGYQAIARAVISANSDFIIQDIKFETIYDVEEDVKIGVTFPVIEERQDGCLQTLEPRKAAVAAFALMAKGSNG